jgi:DNA-binding NarL/FixJ family response regulator
MVKTLRPTLVLMDVTMPLLNGLQATCQILKAVPATKVLMLSAHSDEAYTRTTQPRTKREETDRERVKN